MLVVDPPSIRKGVSFLVSLVTFAMTSPQLGINLLRKLQQPTNDLRSLHSLAQAIYS